MLPPRSPKSAGFSLIELLLVIAIIGILAGTLIFSVQIIVGRAKVAKTRATVAELDNHLEQYNTELRGYPPAELLVIELRKPDRQGIPYYEFRADALGGPGTQYQPVRIMDPGTGALSVLPPPSDEFVLDGFDRPLYYVPKEQYDALPFAAWDDRNGNSAADIDETYYYPATYQVWSAGEDGIVRGVTYGGRLIPALMLLDDKRDNDLDGLFDADDTMKASKAKPVPQNLPEDDLLR